MMQTQYLMNGIKVKKLTNRTKLECCIAILDTVRYANTKSKILKITKIDRDVGNQYLDMLVDLNYIRKIRYTNTKYKYDITVLGMEILDEHKEILKLFKGLGNIKRTKKRCV